MFGWAWASELEFTLHTGFRVLALVNFLPFSSSTLLSQTFIYGLTSHSPSLSFTKSNLRVILLLYSNVYDSPFIDLDGTWSFAHITSTPLFPAVSHRTFFPGKIEKIRNDCEFCIWQLVHPFGDGKLPASIKTVNVLFSLAILRTFPIMPLHLYHESGIWYSMRHKVDLLCDWLIIYTDSQWYPYCFTLSWLLFSATSKAGLYRTLVRTVVVVLCGRQLLPWTPRSPLPRRWSPGIHALV